MMERVMKEMVLMKWKYQLVMFPLSIAEGMFITAKGYGPWLWMIIPFVLINVIIVTLTFKDLRDKVWEELKNA